MVNCGAVVVAVVVGNTVVAAAVVGGVVGDEVVVGSRKGIRDVCVVVCIVFGRLVVGGEVVDKR